MVDRSGEPFDNASDLRTFVPRLRIATVAATLCLLGSVETDASTNTSEGAAPASTRPLAAVQPSSAAAPARTRRPTSPVKVPGSLFGLGFDTCTAPTQATMDELHIASPYWGVGVYIGGESRGCSQPELTREWVYTQHRRGWRIFPIWVGLQAPTLDRGTGHQVTCSSRPDHAMSGRPASARRQGVAAANRAIDRARGLGLKRGSTLFLDMEAYNYTVGRCNRAVLNFQSGWNHRLHARAWKAGFYSSGASGIATLDTSRANDPGRFTMPDVLWLGWGNGKPDLEGVPYVRDNFWARQRMHQYDLDRTKRFGRVTVHIDQNAILVGKGSPPGRRLHTCGVDLDFGRYRAWGRGARSPQVAAAQCLLRRHGLLSGALSERFDSATARAVGTYQNRRGMRVTRRLTARTWTSLLSGGTSPLVKQGSAGDRVRFLQRALIAALDQELVVDGYAGPTTTQAIRRYQRAVGQRATGVVTAQTWHALDRGRT